MRDMDLTPNALSGGLSAFQALPVEQLLFAVLVQLAVLITIARLFGVFFRRMGQPIAVGEIAAGIVLGPSLLGRWFPEISDYLFRPSFPGVPHEISDPAIGK